MRRLYHFVDLYWGLDDIYRRRIKLSEFDLLNDPAELSGITLPMQLIHDGLIKIIREHQGLVSMSKSWNNPLLWSHYADKHKGVCLGFDVPDEFVYDVTYVSDPIKCGCKDLMDEVALMASLPGHKNPTEALNTKFEPIMKAMLSTKFIDWKYEDEARVITSLEDREEGKCYKNFDNHLQLKEVILGHRCKLPKPELESILNCHLDTVVVRKARQNFETFFMEEAVLEAGRI